MKAYEVKIMRVAEAGAEWHVQSPARLVEFWRSEIERAAWFDPEKEAFVTVNLSTRNHVKSWNLCTLGTLDSTTVHAREVFRAAIMVSAAAIVLMHHHPSGNPMPSAEDLNITRQLIQAGNIIDIPVMDHVVIGTGGSFTSIREAGLVQFGRGV